MIIAYLVYDIPALKACSLTCYSWYIAAVPHIHRTFVFKGADRAGLKSLSMRYALGLLPLVNDLRILQPASDPRWFLPQSFNRRGLRHIFALTNVQSLTVQNLDIRRFIPELQRYFGHFSPTLRSITLESPRCTPRQLSHFFSLFPNLDDIEVRCFAHRFEFPAGTLLPVSTPKLQGQLVLSLSPSVETWELLAASGGLRFCSIHLYPVSKCAPVLLAACAETLEILRIEPNYESGADPHIHFIRELGVDCRQNGFNRPWSKTSTFRDSRSSDPYKSRLQPSFSESWLSESHPRISSPPSNPSSTRSHHPCSPNS